MQPKLHPKDYHEQSIFDSEMTHLFLTQWLMVATTNDLAKDKDFVTINIGPHPLVIQRFGDTLKVFTNVCTHRFAKLQTEERGNRALLCQYHGWNFDENGRPKGIPQKPHFGDLDEAAVQKLCLYEWQLETVGNFIFVRHTPSEQSLDAFLGEQKAILLQFSTGMGPLIDRNVLDLDCNWKVAVENTLESYHVATIHPKTFYRLGAAGLEFSFKGPHSSWEALLNEKAEKQWNSIAKYFEARPVKLPGYAHHLVFPNTTYATTFGNSFSIQFFMPVSPDKTRFTSLVFSTHLEGEQKRSVKTIQDTLNTSIVAFNRQVFSEDKDICKQVQAGVKFAVNEGILSDIEDRVQAFQSVCASLEGIPYGHALVSG